MTLVDISTLSCRSSQNMTKLHVSLTWRRMSAEHNPQEAHPRQQMSTHQAGAHVLCILSMRQKVDMT